MAPYMFTACVFCYTALDPDDIKILFKEHNECLCLVHDCCIQMDDDGYGVGVDTNKAALVAAKAGNSVGHCCILKAFCCQLGLKFPETCCVGASHCLCIKEAQAIPFDSDTVTQPLCAICCVQVLPDVGVMQSAPELPSMVR